MVGTAVPRSSGRTFLLEPQSVFEVDLADRYHDLLGLPDAQLQRRLVALIEDEDRLPEPERYAATRDRLLAWLRLAPEDRRIIAAAFEAALLSLPPDFRTRRIEAERAAIVNGMRFDEFRELSTFVPWIRDEAATVLADSPGSEGSDDIHDDEPFDVAA